MAMAKNTTMVLNDGIRGRFMNVRDAAAGVAAPMAPRATEIECANSSLRSITHPASPEVLTVAEVAQRLRCSKAHVCNAIAGKVRGVSRLPAVKMGHRKLIRSSSLDAWLAENEPAELDAIILPSRGNDAVDAERKLNA